MANFSNAIKLAEQFFDHGLEFGVGSEAEYLKLANDFLVRQKNLWVSSGSGSLPSE